MDADRKQKLVEEYTQKEQLYSEYALLIKNLLEGFLRSEKFKFQIFHRSKDKKKLGEKIERKVQDNKEYETLDDIEDLAGVRIVFYLEDDKKNFLASFLREFKNCIVDQEEKYDPRGYKGKHFIFRLDKKRATLVEYRKYTGLKCEIQISTILFHAWSEVEHDIVYKPDGNKKLLQELGLDDLKQSFEKVMVEHLQAATAQLDYLNKKNKIITNAGKIFSSDFIADISSSKNNDEIYEMLDVVKDFYHKKPEKLIALINAVIGKQPLAAVLLQDFGGYKIYGKTHEELIMKCLELLSNIRYFKPDEVLQLLAILSLNTNKNIVNKSLEVVKKFSQYDFNVLTKSKIGYGAQRKALDFLLAWTREEQFKHIDFVETVLKELLSSSVEGTTTGLNEESQYTITMHSGAVSPNDFLKKMRREVIDLTYELYKVAENPKLKLKFVEILDETTHTPSNVAYGDDVAQMIVDDLKYLTGIYQRIIFGESKNEMTEYLGIVSTIEERLYWINKSEKRRTKESEKLRKDILNNDFYQLFRLLVGDPVTYQEQEGWDTADKTRNEKISQIIDSIKASQIEEWFEKLNKIASQYVLVDDWKFNLFKGLLRKLSEKKPSIADALLKKAFKKNSPLKHFTGGFLDGFRMGAHFKIWDRYVGKIIDMKDILLVKAIIFSLNLPSDADLKKLVREKDIKLLEEITKKTGQFSFLKKVDDQVLQYALFNTLVRNFRYSPKIIESLLVEEIENYPKYLNIFFSELQTATYRKLISVKELGSKTIRFLQEMIVDIPSIDWHVQGLLLEIGEQCGLEPVLDVFMKRIKKDATRKEKKKWRIDERYEPIPYHFNPGLSKFIIEHPEYEKIATKWLIKMTADWSTYNWHVSHLLQRLGKRFDEILLSLIKKGDDGSLMKAARAMHSIEGTNFDLCVEIVRRTDNNRILSQVDSNLYTTGVVSGEYGIALAYENKAKTLEKYKEDKSERVKKFANRMIGSFLDSAKRERRRTDEEKQLRKIEFEG